VSLLSGYGEPGSEEHDEDAEKNDDDTSVSAGARRRE
jgi:hypothetical protein